MVGTTVLDKISVISDVKLFNSLFTFRDLRLRAGKPQQPNAIILKLQLNSFHCYSSRIPNKIKFIIEVLQIVR